MVSGLFTFCNDRYPVQLPFTAVYKTGMRTRGRGHYDACAGTCDSGRRDERLGDVNIMGCGDVWDGDADAGHEIQRCRDVNKYCKSQR